MYSLDFRKHALAIGQKEGLSLRQLAARFGVAVGTIVKWKKNLTPCLKRNKKPTKISHERLLEDVKMYPDSYQYERAERLGVSCSCIQFALKRLKVTYKKNSESSKSGCRKAIWVLPENSDVS